MPAPDLAPADSPLFDARTDPEGDVESFVLTGRCARHQRTLGGPGPAASESGRYLWLRVDGPDCPGDIGLVDAVTDTVTAVADTAVSPGTTPTVVPETGAILWVDGPAVRRLDPRDVDGPGAGAGSGSAAVETVGTVDPEVAGGTPDRAASHLTRSSDGERLSLDFRVDGEWCIGAMDAEDGATEVWQRFETAWGHAQFCPSDPNLLLTSYGPWADDPGAGPNERNSLRLVRRALGTRRLTHVPKGRYRRVFWAADGAGLWVVDADEGTRHVSLETGWESREWPAATGHVDAAGGGQRLVGTVPTESGDDVRYRDARREATVTVASALPPLDGDWVGPRPAFVADDSHVAYTTSVDGRADLALASVRALHRAAR